MLTKTDVQYLEGKFAQFATREDLSQFATREDLSQFATREDLSQFATKEDFGRFATKEDLNRFATKNDLSQFATKDDLNQFPTKKDLAQFATKKDIKKLREEIHGDIDSLEYTLNAKIDDLDTKIEEYYEKSRNDVIQFKEDHESRIERLEQRQPTLSIP